MAYIESRGNRIVARFKFGGIRRSITFNIKPTAANIKALTRQCDIASERLSDGDAWEDVRAWLIGEKEPAPRTKSVGYYAQHLFDHTDVKYSTLDQYITNYNNYWLHWDDRRIDTISRMDVERHLRTLDLSTKTKRNILSTLSQIFEVAVRNGDIDYSPVDKWRFKTRQKPEIEPYTEAERDSLLSNMPTVEAWRIFFMAFHSGMRTGELHALRWRNVERPYITVEENRTRSRLTTIKTERSRRVLLHDAVWEMLDEIPNTREHDFVFSRPNGKPLLDGKWMMEQWYEAHDKANVPRRKGHPKYPWRHTYISLALAAGAADIWVAKQAGHDLNTMKEKYARWIKGRIEADQAELSKIYGNKRPPD